MTQVSTPVSHFLGCSYGKIDILFASRSNAGDDFSRRCELSVSLIVRNKKEKGVTWVNDTLEEQIKIKSS